MLDKDSLQSYPSSVPGKFKLTDEDVRDLRQDAALGVPVRSLAETWGLTCQHVRILARGVRRPEAGGPFVRFVARREVVSP